MKIITRLSLALIMFSLFSISYFVTSAAAQQAVAGTPGMPPTGVAPTGTPGMPPTGVAPTGAPGMPPTGVAPTGTPGMPPTGVAPTGAPGMPPTGVAPTGTPGMPPTGVAPTGTSESGGISNWIKGGLKALGIGSKPKMGEGGEDGGPAVQN